jgi:Zn-dependent protease with chaperone function
MYTPLAICLSLTGLLLINHAGALLSSLIWRSFSGRMNSKPAYAKAQFLFLLRVMPLLGAILCVGGIFLPAYLIYEPPQTDEAITYKLAIPTALSLYVLIVALRRWITVHYRTAKLTRNWLRQSERMQIDGIDIPSYRIHHPFPLIAILGFRRPKLFIAKQVLESFTDREFIAAVAHERSHLISGDNLKRAILGFCRDSLLVKSLGRSLDRQWLANSELAADEYAVSTGSAAALNLASALVKVARIAPQGAMPAMFAEAHLAEYGEYSIQSRVLHLTQLADRSKSCRGCGTPSNRQIAWALILSVAIILGWSSGSLSAIHDLLERFVAAVQ